MNEVTYDAFNKFFGHIFKIININLQFSYIEKYRFQAFKSCYKKYIYLKLHIVIILIFKVQQMCIKVHVNAQKIDNTSYESFDLKTHIISQSNKLMINK